MFRVHRRIRMGGRDPQEGHRRATSLELLFDLTFVVAFGTAANELAQYLARGHAATGLIGFAFATLGISWAWIQFAWFASAYDTDDWIYRLTTMVQMLGVLIFALGLPVMFESIDTGGTVDNSVMVAGYVVIRLAMVLHWLRAARQDPDRRRACLTYARTILVAQTGWIALLLARTSLPVMVVWVALLILVELAGPVDVELRKGGTPWHPHHIAERYGLIVIIALGEGVRGTTAALAAIIGPRGPGWSADVVVLGLAGTALIFGMWWTYFVLPWGQLLARHRERSIGWGYGHIVLFGALVAVGAGLHVAAFYVDKHSVLDVEGTVLAVAIPVLLYVLSLYALYSQLVRSFDPFHLLLLAGMTLIVATSVVLAAAGAPPVWSLLLLALTPWVAVIGYETIGHRRGNRMLAET